MILSAVPLLLPNLNSVLQVVFGTTFLLFSFYGFTTVRRHFTKIQITDQGLSLRSLGETSVKWPEISGLNVAYFSTNRDGSNGWMQLSLSGNRHRIKIDSRLEGFQKIARLAVNSTRANHLTLDPITIDNLIALGIPSNDVGEGAFA